MQTQPDYLSVPRRALDIEDYIDILRRHWMWIVGPAFAGLVIGVVVAFLWPDTYVSYAVMRITPASVPDRLVPTNFQADLRERLQTMHQDVTSRQRLIEMIKKYNLYAKEQEKQPLEDIVEGMSRRIRIIPTGTATGTGGGARGAGSAFRIEFAYNNRLDAKRVVEEIVSGFTTQNVISRREKSRQVSDFLSDELKAAKADLDRIEAEITQFKLRNAGSLPEEMTANLQMQQGIQVSLQGTTDLLNRLQQDKLILETQVQNLKNQLETIDTTTLAAQEEYQANERLMTLERQVSALANKIAAMKQIYRPQHPDLIAAITQLETLQNERDALARLEEKQRLELRKREPRRIMDAAALARRQELEAQIRSTQVRIHTIEMDMKERMNQQQRLQNKLNELSARIGAGPLRQTEYVKLMRDYNLAKAKYDDLNMKKSASETANRLEDRSAGENLEVLDPASLPVKPTEPNRWLIVGAALATGLILGLFLAGARELKDTTMKGLKDVRAYSNMNILSSIPLLENALLVRRKRRLTWLAWSSAMILGVVAMSGSIYYYYVRR
jgi:succinoglycan biosynthesis transport protein ExoP